MARPVTFPLLFMVVEGCWLGRSPPKDLGLARPISLEGLLIDQNTVVRLWPHHTPSRGNFWWVHVHATFSI